ncbi:methyl-accepting chemotaxis protein, partial [uncultured Helicobacter sp.]|uniref:methyl-accepting chemotaxis protein n=1 Tax=uncultured Helicobacter sp. TaxID=175537 RepID=UPI00261C7247
MKFALGINAKVLLSTTILVLISFGVLAYFVYFGTKQTITHIEYDAQEKKIAQLESLITVYVDEKKRLIYSLAQEALGSGLNESQMIQNLKLIQTAGDFNLAYIGLESNGRMLRSNGNHTYASDEYDPRSRSWFSIPKTSLKDEVLGEPWIQTSYKIPVFGFSAPLIMNGKFVGVASADIALKSLNKYIHTAKSIEENMAENVIILDSKGRYVSHINEEKLLTSDDMSQKILSYFNSQEEHFILNSDIATCKIHAQTQWLLCSIIPQESIINKVYDNNMPIFTMLIIFATFLIVALYLLLRYLLRPIGLIKVYLLEFFAFLNHKNKEIKPLVLRSKDEFQEMAEVIGQNVESVQKNILQDNHSLEAFSKAVEQIKRGYLHLQITSNAHNPQINQLGDLLNEMLHSFNHNISHILSVLQRYADNNYIKQDTDIISALEGELQTMNQGVFDLGAEIRKMLVASLDFAQKLNDKAKDLEASTNGLSESSKKQVQSLRETAQAVEEITSSMQNVSG